MNKNLYYDLFQYLYDHYDINSGPSLENYTKTRVRENQKLIDIRDVKNMLNDLEKRGIITWRADKITTNQDGITSYHWLDIPKYKNDLGKDDNHTFENIRVEAHLTPDIGLEYVVNILNRKEITLTNKRIKDLTYVLVIIGTVTLFIQGLQCNISRRQLKQSQPTSQSSTIGTKDTLPEDLDNKDGPLKAKVIDTSKIKVKSTTALTH